MSSTKNHFEPFAAILTETGLVKLGNLIEEYQSGQILSDNKLAQLSLLLVTYYFETENMIHLEIFNATNNELKKQSGMGRATIQNSIKILHENGLIKRNPNHKRITGGRK